MIKNSKLGYQMKSMMTLIRRVTARKDLMGSIAHPWFLNEIQKTGIHWRNPYTSIHNTQQGAWFRV